MERLRASKVGQDLLALETAYGALAGKGHPDFIFTNTDAPDVVIAEAKKKDRRSGPRAGSVRATLEEILNREPELWDYEHLAKALEREGVAVRDEDGKVKSSLRTAVWTLVKEGVAGRGPEGTIYAMSFHDELERLGAFNDIFSAVSDAEREGG